MTTENDGFDAGDFFDKRVEEAGFDQEELVSDSPENEDQLAFGQEDTSGKEQQETETEQVETEQKIVDDKATDSSAEDIQAALESTGEEEEQEADSAIASLLPKTEEVEQQQGRTDNKGQYVPVEDHIKLRKRAQEAERQRDEALARLNTQTDGAKSGEQEETELSPLEKFVEENPEEDFVPAKVQLEQKQWEERLARANAEAIAKREEQQRLEAEDRQQKINSLNAYRNRATDLEKNFRKEHNDYDLVTKPVTEGNIQLTQQEKMAILKSDNPAQKLYETCKARRDGLLRMLGINPADNQQTPNPNPKPKTSAESNAEEEYPDEQVLRDIFNQTAK